MATVDPVAIEPVRVEPKAVTVGPVPVGPVPVGPVAVGPVGVGPVGVGPVGVDPMPVDPVETEFMSCVMPDMPVMSVMPDMPVMSVMPDMPVMPYPIVKSIVEPMSPVMPDMPVMPDPIVKSIVEPMSPVMPDPIVDPIGLDAIEGDPIGVDSIGTDPEPAILDSIGTGLSPLGSELSVAPVPAEVIIGAPVVIATTVTVGASVPGSTVDSPCSARAVLISTSSSTAALYLAVSSTIKASWVTTTWVARVEAEVFLASRSATSSEVQAGSRLLEVVTTKMLTMTRASETLYVLVLLASKASAMLTRAVFTSSQVDTLRRPRTALLADEGTKLAVFMESRPVLAASACAFVSVAAAIAAAAASFVALAAAA